jgi:hypothetical protein
MTSENNKQTLETKKIRSYCDSIARELNEFSSTYNVIVIITGAQSNSDALLEKQSEILELPHGQNFFNKLKTYLSSSTPHSGVVGIITENKKALLGLQSKERFTAIVNLDAAGLEEEAQIKEDVYALIANFISITEDIKNKNESLFSVHNEITAPKWTEVENATRNILADTFAGAIMQLNGNKTAFRNIAKRRAHDSFTRLQFYDATAYPFPTIMETAILAYEDVLASAHIKDNAFKIAINTAQEVRQSLEENAVLQWQSFIRPAREMAAADIPIQQILGAAVYTSDNVYNRTFAHMIAEIINCDPAPIIQFDGYNAFADLESQQRAHRIACLEILDFAMQESLGRDKPVIYIEIAEKNCQMLFEGKPCGWCAPAIFEVAKTLNADPNTTKERISEIFSEHTHMLQWDVIRIVHRNLLGMRAQGKEITFNTLIDILRQEDETRDAAISMKTLQNLLALKKAATPSQPFLWEDFID